MSRALRSSLVVLAALAAIAGVLHAPAASGEPLSGPSVFVGLGPTRVLDTRAGLGAPKGAVVAGGSLTLALAGSAGIPATGATAVALNVTMTRAAGPGFVQVFPTGQAAVGASSNLNVVAADQTISNLVVVPLGDNGRVTLYTQGGGDLLADVLGYFEAATGAPRAGRYVALPPARVVDTRSGAGLVIANPGDARNCSDFPDWYAANRWFWHYEERYGDVAKLDANGDQIPCESLWAAAGNPTPGKPRDAFATTSGGTIQFSPLGAGGVPATGVRAVVVNVTATDAAPGFVSVFPGGPATPTSSNLNVTLASPTVANLAIVPVDASGLVTIYTESPAQLVVDVAGYFTDATAASSTTGMFVALRPTRLLDTRTGTGAPAGKVGAGKAVAFAVRGAAGVPADAVAAFVNVTATEATAPGYVQVLPTGQATIGASSNLNVTATGQTVAAAVFATISTSTGGVSAYTQSGAHLLADIAGYFTGAGDTVPTTTTPGPTTTLGPPPGPLFPNATTYAVATHPHASVIVDLDADGKRDVAVANAGSNSVVVRKGDGAGGLGSPTSYAVGTEPKSIAAGDLNGDGRPDLVTANQGSSDVSVLLANGSGGFAAAVAVPAAPNSHEAAIGDLNGDGKLDIVAVGWGGSVASVLLGNGNGTFAPKVDYTVGAAPHSVVIVDVNGDGRPDLVTANHDSGTVSVLLGNGNGTFGAKTDYTVGSGPHSVRAGDLDGDGRPDLVVANDSSSSISVLRNLGGGTFAAKVDYATVATPKTVALGDVNGDGILDVLVACIDGNYPSIVNAGGDRVGLLLGTGTGTFGARTDYTAGTGAFNVALGDLDGDGRPDLVVANWHDGTIQVRRNQS